MKKKLLLFIAMVVMLMCVFALSASAAEPNTNGETFELSDGTKLPLWDTDGNGLIWFKSTANPDDGFTNYDCVHNNQKDTSTKPYITHSLWSGNNGAGTCHITGYQTSEIKIVDIAGNNHTSKGTDSTVVFANLKGAMYNDTTLINCFNSTFKGNKALEGCYLDEGTQLFIQDVFNNASNLRYINFEELDKVLLYGSAIFAECPKLANIVLSPVVQSIGDYPFQNTAITEITIPETVTSWTGGAHFKNCKSLTKITGFVELYERGVLTTTVPTSIFENCSLLEMPFENGIIPHGVTSIGNNAFYSCKAITSVILPSTLESIGSYAFHECTGLTSITVPNNVKTISTGAFMKCRSLVSINLGASVNNIMNYDILNTCSALKTIHMPETITKIPINTFKDTNNITTVYFTGSLQQITDLIASASSVSGNSGFTNLTTISWTAYQALEDKSGKYIIYDYNKCDAFYNGIHVEKLNEGEIDTNPCVITLCAQCKGTNLDSSSESTHSLNTVIAYANGFNLNGTRTTTCQHAGCAYNSSESAKPEAIGAIFTGFGISTRIEDDSDLRGIAFTMLIDRELLAEYEENTGTALSYGVLTTFAQAIGTNNPLDNTGTPILEKGIVATDISHAEVYAVDLVIKGTKALWEEEAYELDLYMLGYTVENGNVTYMGTVNSVATASANITDLKTTTYKEQIGE